MYGISEQLKSFEYKGFTYDYMNVGDDDCDKICHEVVAGPIRVHFDWSSYSFPTVEQLKQFIDLGCPERINGGPLDQRDLDFIRDHKMITYTFDLQSNHSEWSRTGVRVTAVDEPAAREYAAQVWPRCTVLNFRPDNMAQQAEELAAIESAIGGQ